MEAITTLLKVLFWEMYSWVFVTVATATNVFEVGGSKRGPSTVTFHFAFTPLPEKKVDFIDQNVNSENRGEALTT